MSNSLHHYLRKSNEEVSLSNEKYRNIFNGSATYDYEGGFEEYEDALDYVKRPIRGRIIA